MVACGMDALMRRFEILAGLACIWALAQSPADAYAASKDSFSGPAKFEQAGTTKSLSPALFKVAGARSTLYLLGSIHVLPVGFVWRTPALDAAINTADVFVFETNLDFSTAEFHYYMDNHGYLPRGQTLHKMLSPLALKNYVSLIHDMHIDPDKLDYLRPGVAVFLLQRTFIGAHSSVPLVPGVDATLIHYAKSNGKQLAYLESLQSQFEILTALGGGSDVGVLEKILTSRSKNGNEYQTMLAAWTRGDLAKLASLEDADEDPTEQALMLDNRNKAWLPRIEDMLRYPQTYLITVGALHLTGPKGVIGLLCARHWKVQRVQTGPAPPPPACPS